MMNLKAALEGISRRRASYAVRSMSSTGAASTEVRKLGVIGAGQMVSTIESRRASMIKFLAGLGHSVGSVSESRGASYDSRQLRKIT